MATKLVIIGGVAGGATAAARARRLSEDAEIIVLERGPNVSFANCGLPYHIGGKIPQRASLLLQTPASLNARHNLDVRVRSEVLAIDHAKKEVVVREVQTGREYRESYDKLILSPGAGPIRPPLPGIDHAKIFTLRNVPDTDAIKKVVDGGAKSAVVIGGGFIGLEMAENLKHRGLDVHLVELLDQVMPPLDKEMATAIHQTLRLNGVHLHLSDAVASFADAGDAGITATLKSGVKLTADFVVLSIGVKAESKLAEAAGLKIGERGGIVVDDRMRTDDPHIYAVGDAVIVKDFVTGSDTLIPLAGPANRQGRIAADNALGRDSSYRGTQGTSVVAVFNLTVAMTGASEKTLRRAGIDYEKVYLHPGSHVGYYPGAEQMHFKLLFSKPDGKVLAAQITGGSGVDKRVDVIAMAIQAGMTVYDLEEVELAYAPQYGAAKDPVNMAGFIASNLLRGDVKVAHADQLDGQFVLDVRDEIECEMGVIPGAKIIPLNSLRKRHGELPKDRCIHVNCAVGLRGYVAARMLTQLGYDAVNISGGYGTYRAYFPPESGGVTANPTPAAPNSGGAAPSGPCGSPTSGGTCNADDGFACDGSPRPKALSQRQETTSMTDTKIAETLDVRSRQCPGPIVAMSHSLKRLDDGDVLKVLATDPGFTADVPAWCRQTGNELLSVLPENDHFAALIRKRAIAANTSQAAAATSHDKTMVVFSNDLDRAMAVFIIANGAASMGRKVTLFFTYWGLNILRRPEAVSVSKTFIERMFGWMMPRGADKLSLSKMNMGGVGKAMMKGIMRKKNVDSLPSLIQSARDNGVHLVACAMSMDVMGIRREELIDGVEIAGVGAYLAAAETANVNLFI